MIETLTALLVVLGGIVLLRIALQFGGWPGAGSRRRTLRVVETCGLGAKQRLHVVEVDGQRLLIGATEGSVNLLERLGECPGAQEDSDETASENTPVGRGVRGWLRAHGLALLVTAILVMAGAGSAWAQTISTGDGAGPATLTLALDEAAGPERISSSLQILALLTLVSVAPSLLLMATCFTRIVIVFSFLRQAIGVHSLPPNQVLAGLALFTTFFVMAPVGERIRVEAYEPYVAGDIEATVASERALEPVREFLTSHIKERDLDLFLEIAGSEEVASLEEVPMTTLLPAYMISELRTAFEIGFVIFLPFLVIDIVIASLLISMQMIVLPPIVISLPFKLILFVLLDGWNLVLGSLVSGLR